MANRFDRLSKFDSLKFIGVSRDLSRLLGTVLVAKVVLLIFAIAGLSGCMASVPSTFPEIQVPSPSSPTAGIPSPSSSTSQPSGGGTPQPSGGGQPSIPTPSLPTPGTPAPSTPSIPQPPSPIPSPDSSSGGPSMPRLPSPGGQNSPDSGDGDGGSPESGDGGQGNQENSGGGGMDMPSGDSGFPGGDPEGQPEGDQSGDSNGTMQPGDDGSEGGGWETSNQLPDPNAGDSGEEGNADEEGDESDSEGGTGEDEMQQVLGDLDGEILSERNAANERVNDELAGAVSLETGEGEEMGTGEIDDVEAGDVASEDEQNQGTGGGEDEEEADFPEPQESAKDTPDARDEQVIARQMKEAALAEEDPELKKKLWDEYEKYVDGLK
ncbi:MAG: hypothetical protein F4Z01_10110 [Gammaproteobacteria bacterium]|nr:hypothetical protein [Gammaproteobacteria bacterium]MYF38384.1 hypothetical protein [Gammaproteobacteria bacterium]